MKIKIVHNNFQIGKSRNLSGGNVQLFDRISISVPIDRLVKVSTCDIYKRIQLHNGYGFTDLVPQSTGYVG